MCLLFLLFRSPYTPSSQKMGGSEMAVSAKQKLQSEVYG